jgi:hypothetical protein
LSDVVFFNNMAYLGCNMFWGSEPEFMAVGEIGRTAEMTIIRASPG